jgi:hypothetical protein
MTRSPVIRYWTVSCCKHRGRSCLCQTTDADLQLPRCCHSPAQPRRIASQDLSRESVAVHAARMSLLKPLISEVVEDIASFLDQVSLAMMSLNCKRLNTLCTPTLYGAVLLDDLGCCNFRPTIEKKPDLGILVQSITFNHGKYYADQYSEQILPLLANLHRLHFFVKRMGFFDRGFEEDENTLGLGLW